MADGRDRPYSFFENLSEEGEIQDIDEIISLGSARAAHDAQALKRHRITHIICVHPSIEFRFEKSISYLRIPLPDAPFEMLSPHIPEVCDFIDKARRQRGRVLIHCQKGISRSSAFVFVYLMRHCKYTFDEAWKLVESKRKRAFPNVGFQVQLIKNCHRDISNEEISREVLAKVHTRFCEVKELLEKILSMGGVALNETKEKWQKLGLYFENLHKYKFIPQGVDEENLTKEAKDTLKQLQSLQNLFSPTIAAVKYSQALAKEIEQWLEVLAAPRKSTRKKTDKARGESKSDSSETEEVNKKMTKKEKKKMKMEKKEKKKDKKKMKKEKKNEKKTKKKDKKDKKKS